VEHEQAIGEIGCVVTGYGSGWIVEERRESDCILQKISACEENQNPSCSEEYACCIIHWPCSHAGCSEPAHVHTRDTLLTGRVPIDRLIYVEDFCLISVGVENVS
jgi:hypothetical protein